jgi:hypothetical protein
MLAPVRQSPTWSSDSCTSLTLGVVLAVGLVLRAGLALALGDRAAPVLFEDCGVSEMTSAAMTAPATPAPMAAGTSHGGRLRRGPGPGSG